MSSTAIATNLERRFVTAQLRAAGDGMHFTGYAAKFNDRTYIGPPKQGFYEAVAPGAFARSLKERDVPLLFNHGADNLLGRTSSGTLRLKDDGIGLLTDADLPDTSLGRDVSTLVQRRDIAGMSFAFLPAQDRWETLPGGHAQLRTLLDVDLYDVSVVTNPAYPTTTASVRSRARLGSLDARGVAAESRAGALDYGLVSMCQAADAAIDAAAQALGAGNAAQAAALLCGASLSIEEALWSLWCVDPDTLTALGAGDILELVSAVDSAIDAAYAACASGTTDPTTLQEALTASDALLARLDATDAAAGDDERIRAVLTQHRRRWLAAARIAC